MKNFKISLITLLLAGFLAACANGTTITGNPPENPLPQIPACADVGGCGDDDGGGDRGGNGGGVTINKAAFTKAALAANPLWKDDDASDDGSKDDANEGPTAEYFVEFSREGDVNIYPTDDREYFSFKYIVRLDGSVVAGADDKGIGLIGALNEEMTGLNLWLISKDGTVVATLTSDISEEDKTYFINVTAWKAIKEDEKKEKETVMETVEKVGTVSDNIQSTLIDTFKKIKDLKKVVQVMPITPPK